MIGPLKLICERHTDLLHRLEQLPADMLPHHTVPHPLTVGPIFILLLAAACCFTVHTQYKLIFTLFQDFSHHPLGIHMKFHHMARCFFVFHGIILCLMLLVGYKHLQQAFPNFSSCRCRHCPQPLPLIQTQLPARE